MFRSNLDFNLGGIVSAIGVTTWLMTKNDYAGFVLYVLGLCFVWRFLNRNFRNMKQETRMLVGMLISIATVMFLGNSLSVLFMFLFLNSIVSSSWFVLLLKKNLP